MEINLIARTPTIQPPSEPWVTEDENNNESSVAYSENILAEISRIYAWSIEDPLAALTYVSSLPPTVLSVLRVHEGFTLWLEQAQHPLTLSSSLQEINDQAEKFIQFTIGKNTNIALQFWYALPASSRQALQVNPELERRLRGLGEAITAKLTPTADGTGKFCPMLDACGVAKFFLPFLSQ